MLPQRKEHRSQNLPRKLLDRQRVVTICRSEKTEVNKRGFTAYRRQTPHNAPAQNDARSSRSRLLRVPVPSSRSPIVKTPGEIAVCWCHCAVLCSRSGVRTRSCHHQGMPGAVGQSISPMERSRPPARRVRQQECQRYQSETKTPPERRLCGCSRKWRGHIPSRCKGVSSCVCCARGPSSAVLARKW